MTPAASDQMSAATILWLVLVLATGCEPPQTAPAKPKPARSSVSPFEGACSDEPWESARKNPYRFIAHAGGGIDGHSYTNALEALNRSYARGYRMFELDFVETSDGQIVGTHDWKHWREQTGSEIEHPTAAEFRRAKILGRYTPMTLKDVESWFSAHPDSYLVTDKIRNFAGLLAGFRHHERLLVEVFSIGDYMAATRAGIRYPMLSVHAATGFARGVLFPFIEQTDARFFAFPARVAEEHREALARLRKMNRCVYAFSSNEQGFIENGFGQTFFGVYTDTWHVARGSGDPAGRTY